jgi:hypothetical protein
MYLISIQFVDPCDTPQNSYATNIQEVADYLVKYTDNKLQAETVTTRLKQYDWANYWYKDLYKKEPESNNFKYIEIKPIKSVKETPSPQDGRNFRLFEIYTGSLVYKYYESLSECGPKKKYIKLYQEPIDFIEKKYPALRQIKNIIDSLQVTKEDLIFLDNRIHELMKESAK